MTAPDDPAATDPPARLRAVVEGAAAALEASVDRINDLNVYPVPDGDTGSNMRSTVRAVEEALAQPPSTAPPALARLVARAALLGARGNSGIIASQLVRGLCDALAGAATLDGATAAQALRAGADTAYAAVHEPVEGTILSVARGAAEGAEAAARAGASLDAVLDASLAAAEAALARTPEQLPILREAGVVDAGGAGLVELLRGGIAGLRGEPPPEASPRLREVATLESSHLAPSRYRYCTSYVVEGPGVDPRRLERELSELGDSLVVVGDGEACKAHVHTDEPGAALAVGTRMGVISGVEVANMRQQQEARDARLEAAALAVAPQAVGACDAVVVVAGAGNRRLMEDLGARVVVEGGQTMNPSTGELVEAIAACPAPEVVVLPNNGNVVLAAEQAAAASGRTVAVVGTRSIPAGLAAMVAFDSDRGSEANAAAMRDAAAQVRTGELTSAVRDATANGIAVRKGDYLALLDGRVVASLCEPTLAVRELAERLLAEGGELLTVLRGEAAAVAPLHLDEALAEVAAAHPELEIDVQDGGQPNSPLLLSVE
jgi:DAK2 domain fusion protein YloV